MHRLWYQAKDYNKCGDNFTNFSLKKHKATCKGEQEFDCAECGEIYKSNKDMKKHYELQHKMEDRRYHEVCKWWRKGNCNNKKGIRYAHVGH